MGFAFSPGCPCCCDVCDDTFNRPDSTDIGINSPCELTVVAGTWSIVSNALRPDTFDAPGIVTGIEDSSDSQMMQVFASVSMPAWLSGQVGDPPNCFLLLSDGAGNDYFAYFKFNSGFSNKDGSVSIYKGQPFAGGTVISSKTGLDIPPGIVINPISFCIDKKGILKALIVTSIVTFVDVYATPDAHVGPVPGIGYILPFNGPLKFTEFKVTRTNKDEGCTDCGITCGVCSGKLPGNFQVDLSGFAAAVACPEPGQPKCDFFNASFLIPFAPQDNNPCRWDLALSGAQTGIVCNGDGQTAEISVVLLDGQIEVVVSLSAIPIAVFNRSFSGSLDCAAIDDDLPRINFVSNVCTGAAAACHLKSA